DGGQLDIVERPRDIKPITVNTVTPTRAATAARSSEVVGVLVVEVKVFEVVEKRPAQHENVSVSARTESEIRPFAVGVRCARAPPRTCGGCADPDPRTPPVDRHP